MITSIRDWLFPKVPLLPLQFDDEGYMIQFNGSRKHKTIRVNDEEYIFRCQYNPKEPFLRSGREGPAFPPLHRHLQQNEYVTVIQGKLCYELAGKQGRATAGETLHLPQDVPHTFWVDPTGEEDLIMDFAARPGKGLDEAWIDSFYGVLDSCYRTKQAPHFLQLMAFYDASISLPGNIPKPLGTLIVYIFGHVIAPLAGFTGTYPMYVAETREKS